MSEQKFRVLVTQEVEVTLDAAKFDEAFMEEFRESFFPFDELQEHAQHIAQLQARGMIDATPRVGFFIEGYGESKEMGIVAEVIETEIEVLS